MNRGSERLLHVSHRRLTPDVVGDKAGASRRDPQRSQALGNGTWLVLPVHQRYGPPVRGSLHDPGGCGTVACERPQAAGAAGVDDVNGEHIVAAPVQHFRWDGIAAITAPAARPSDLDSVDEGLIHVIDLAELEVHRIGGSGG